MITHGCATAGCHAPGNATEFTLLRLPQGKSTSRRLTQRNLYNTVQLVNFGKPAESRLLTIASQPHGPLASGVFGDQRSPKYQELVAWVAGLTGTKLDQAEADDSHSVAARRHSAQNITSSEQAVSKTGGKRRSHTGSSADRFPGSVQAAAHESAADTLEPNQPAEIKSVGASEAKAPDRKVEKKSRYEGLQPRSRLGPNEGRTSS